MRDIYSGVSWVLYITSAIFAGSGKMEGAMWLAVLACFFAIKERGSE